MRVITILATEDGASEILDALTEAEEEGLINSPFGTHKSDELSDDEATGLWYAARET
jgi:hypothetical protein